MSEKEVSQFIIYALHHPSSQYVYVGQSSRGMRRPVEHSQASVMKTTHKLPRTKWIKKLHGRGLEAHIVVLEECASVDELNDSEIYYIAYFRSIGMCLLNVTDGGEGTRGYKPTEETLAKLSSISRARAETKEGRAALQKQAQEYWADPVARERKRVQRTGSRWGEETKAKMSAAHKGKPKSAEHRENLRIAAQRRSADPEYREKQRVAQREAQNRPDVRVKKSRAAIDKWNSDEYRIRNIDSRYRRE